MLFCDTNYAKWCKNWLVRKNPQKVTIYNENGLLVCRANKPSISAFPHRVHEKTITLYTLP